jgi:hypothetical protein
MGRQRPFATPVTAFEQAWQFVVEPPSQAFSQQNPSMHDPLWHIVSRVQAVPFPKSVTHLFCVVSQKLFAVQSVSALHEPAQTLPWQWNGAHETGAGAVPQLPEPVQVGGPV